MLRGEITVPGDKSVSHRALLLGALASGETEITNFLPGEDCHSTLQCLEALGVKVIKGTPTEVTVAGKGPEGFQEPDHVLDCGNSGTTARLLLGVLSALPFTSSLTGDASLQQRPMGRVVVPLTAMGADISGRDEARFLPLTLKGRKLTEFSYKLPVASAQVKSALLLAGLLSGQGIELEEPAMSRDHTERMMRYLGAKVEGKGTTRITLPPKQRLAGRPIGVPGDISSATFFLVAAAMLPGSNLLIKNVGVNPTRMGAVEVLTRMGADISFIARREVAGEPVADLRVKGSRLTGTNISGEMIPRLIDEIPVLAVAAACAEGTTRIQDAAELRVKETDRIHALVTELKKLGAEVSELPDGLTITGARPLKGARVATYGDHRMAMSLKVAGLLTQGEVVLDDSQCVNVSFPGFFSLLEDTLL